MIDLYVDSINLKLLSSFLAKAREARNERSVALIWEFSNNFRKHSRWSAVFVN